MLTQADYLRLLNMAPRDGVTVQLLGSDGLPLAILSRNDGVDREPDVTAMRVAPDVFEVRPLTELGAIFVTL